MKKNLIQLTTIILIISFFSEVKASIVVPFNYTSPETILRDIFRPLRDNFVQVMRKGIVRRRGNCRVISLEENEDDVFSICVSRNRTVEENSLERLVESLHFTRKGAFAGRISFIRIGEKLAETPII